MSTERTQTPRTDAIDNAAAELTVWHANHPLTINEFSIREILVRHFGSLELAEQNMALRSATPRPMNPDPESIIRQCMANTPSDHPDKQAIDARLADPRPILPRGQTPRTARDLETELAAVTAERDRLRAPEGAEMLQRLAEQKTEANETAGKLHAELSQVRFILSQIIGALPIRRDWLDPDLEKAARALLDGRGE